MHAASVCGALYLLALLEGALGDEAEPAQLAPSCHLLYQKYSRNKDGSSRADRCVSVQGRVRSVRVHWDAAPGRAAAALLAATLRYQMRYRRVRLASETLKFCELAALAQRDCANFEYSQTAYDDIMLSPAMTWMGRRCLPLEFCQGPTGSDRWVAEPRLALERVGAAAAGLRLHALLAPHAQALPACARAYAWDFYTHADLLQICAFTQPHESQSFATVFIIVKSNKTIYDFKQRIETYALHIKITYLEPLEAPRNLLLRLLQDQKSSFLFLDYDMYSDLDGVIYVAPPPPVNDTHSATLDSTRSIRVADDFVLRQIAFPILSTLHNFSPSPTDLRKILELEEMSLNIEEAVCSWALNNTAKFDSFPVDPKPQHWIAVFLCSDDPDRDQYKTVAKIVEETYRSEPEFNITLHFVEMDCKNEDQLNNEYLRLFLSYKWQKLVGVVAGGRGLARAAASAPGAEAALVYYDVPPTRARLAACARAASGSVHHLAAAIQHFMTQVHWKRLAIISEKTDLASSLHEALDKKELALHNVGLTDVSPSFINNTLNTLRDKNSRIIFINTNAEIAENILCQAHGLAMTVSAEYAWIVRERRAVELKCNNVSLEIDHFTISFWWRGGNDSHLTHANSDGTSFAIRRKLNELWLGSSWPPLAASIADSLQLLVHSFKEFCRSHPDKLFDLHGHGASELLLNALNNRKVNGVVQKLQYKNGTFAEPLVFVDQWKRYQHELLFQWRITNDHKVETLLSRREAMHSYTPSTDGSHFCFTPTSGDPFLPRCHDFVWLITLGFIFLAGLALYLARRVRLGWLARRDALLKAQMLASREFAASALVDHYVDRAALELYHDLGRGCFGRVRFGILRAPERSPVSVAVKEVHDDVSPAEETELLREACTIATLRHDHVVRLIGVCTTGSPLLLLMEYAFFGDLREYLCERRHLADRISDTSGDETDESYHISAVSLTRLGKEAACALAYLTHERLVHRDVRASNCLVDARRSLKLADFGLARKIGTGVGGEAEYSCRRCGLFPVLWMAPESLERGVFTAASDAWALGVLLLELATLGARPYGAWPPLRVLRYVSAGGHPPLPPDASPDTQRILETCWRRSPEERAGAAALAVELQARPGALRPALLPPPEPAEPTDTPESPPPEVDASSVLENIPSPQVIV